MSFLKHLLPAWKKGIEDKSRANAAVLAALSQELSTAETEAMQGKILMSLDTSTGEWLDAYGRLFGVLRKEQETDEGYRERIVSYILLKRGTIPSIIDAIQNFLEDEETQVDIYEPYTNIFYLNSSRLNGPDHLLGEYYTFAVIDIRISKPFPLTLLDIINEFKPAGVSVRLTYRPDKGANDGVVQLPLSTSTLQDTSRKAVIMNGMNDRINGHLNLTEGARSEPSELFILNQSKLNSDDRLTGSFAMSNPSFSLASYATTDLKFTQSTTVSAVAGLTEAMSTDFYTKTGAEESGYALQTLVGAKTNYLHISLDMYSYFEQAYSSYLREVQPSGVYPKSTYLSLIDNPTVQYSFRATTPPSTPVTCAVQFLNVESGLWETVATHAVNYTMQRGQVNLPNFSKYLASSGVVFTRIRVLSKPQLETYDFHLHLFELGFTKEIAVRPTISPLMVEVTSQVNQYPV